MLFECRLFKLLADTIFPVFQRLIERMYVNETLL